MSRKLRKFKLAGSLPRLTRLQVQVTNALLCHLPQTVFVEGFKEQLKGALEPLVHADVDIWLDSVRSIGVGGLREVLAEPSCTAIIGMPPRIDKALLEVELTIAQQAIDKLLGGNAEEIDSQRPLSEIEDGIFSYVLLRVLSLLQEAGAAERQVTLKLEGVHGTVASLQERFPIDERFVCLSFKLFFDVKVGFCRLYLPESIVKETFPEAPPTHGLALERWLRRLQERQGAVSLLRTPIVVEVGRIALRMADVEALDIDDIILIEETELRLQEAVEEEYPTSGHSAGASAHLTGRVQARVGDGHRGVISGAVVVGEHGRYELQIEEIAPMGEPRPRAHLFRGDIEEESMAAENARQVSERGIVEAYPFGAMLRRRATSAALCGAAAALAGVLTPGGPLAVAPEGEHSDADAPLPEAAALLEDITVALVVELGRVMVSAADVVQLRPGQVIELSRAPAEPVDLVVDGKRIGKGELVEIDGELGVRILSLAK